MREHMIARRRRDPCQPRLVGERFDDRAGERPRSRVVMEPVHAVDERLVLADRGPVHQRHRPAGGGLEMAVACDLIVVEEDSRLALPEVNLGVFPGSGGTIRVTRRIGEGRAKEMMFTCEPIDAQKALAWGLVNRVAPKGQALDVAMELATKIAAKPNLALQWCKESVDLSFDTSENEAIQRTLALIDRAFASNDCQEGVRAFIEKRPPRYTHS